MTLEQLVEKMCWNPARIANIPGGELKAGAIADMFLADGEDWTVDARRFYSKGRNTPLDGKTLSGRVLMTFQDGRIVHQREEF